MARRPYPDSADREACADNSALAASSPSGSHAPDLQPVRLAYQPPVSSTFVSEQINHQQPANSTFLSAQISTSHQANEQALILSPLYS
jgi:hypothetical protein